MFSEVVVVVRRLPLAVYQAMFCPVPARADDPQVALNRHVARWLTWADHLLHMVADL